MNAGGATNSKDPVENQSWNNPRDGGYTITVDQYNQRSRENVGFQMEIECGNQIHQLSFEQNVTRQVPVVKFMMVKGQLTNLSILDKRIKHQGLSQSVWGVNTETFVKVNTLMLSPNHWDDNAVGNKHWFFILEGCANPEGTRGIYNEFLRSNLEPHRKVFEVLGSKTRCVPNNDQLSGLGFSSTRGDEVTIRVTGTKINKIYKVKFA